MIEQEITAKEGQVAAALRALGRRIANGDESELLEWVIPKKLACAHRPLRYNRVYGGSVRNLEPAATPLIVEWAELVEACGIRSIICLMYDNELRFYNALELGQKNLVDFYDSCGFTAVHIPWEDPAHSKTAPTLIDAKRHEIRQRALFPKPELPRSAGLLLRRASRGRTTADPLEDRTRKPCNQDRALLDCSLAN